MIDHCCRSRGWVLATALLFLAACAGSVDQTPPDAGTKPGADAGLERCPDGHQDNDKNGVCALSCAAANLSCGPGGSCSDLSGTAKCECVDGYEGADCQTCASGYQDNDADGTCEPTCASAQLGCVAGACEDLGGTPRCACEEGYAGALCDTCAAGYQDNDFNNVCEQGCDSVELGCVYGVCDDSTGTATCACDGDYTGAKCDACTAGYQDNNTDGTCRPSCALLSPDCGQGSCDDASGSAMCLCTTGYAGADCRTCAEGYQDHDGNGTCVPGCALANLGCVNGTCADESGAPVCQCSPRSTGALCDTCVDGWTGAACDTCARSHTESDCQTCLPGYQDNDGNGTCEPACSMLSCPTGATCLDSAGPASCFLPETCADVLTVQPNAPDGDYVLFHQSAPENAWIAYCLNMATTPAEYLRLRYVGRFNNQFRRVDDSGGGVLTRFNLLRINPETLRVKVDDYTYATSVGQSGEVTQVPYATAESCSADGSLMALSAVHLGGTRFRPNGVFCSVGASAGSQVNEDANFDHQRYVLLGFGGPECGGIAPRPTSCDEPADPNGWDMQLQMNACTDLNTGPDCTECRPGSQDHDADGVCLPDCSIAEIGCVNGTCSDATGIPTCACSPGYAGALCNLCAVGYQDNDRNGVCLPICETSQVACAHGVCSDSSGVATCDCPRGWTGAACDTCAPEYTGEDCQQCAPGYQDHDGDGICSADCATAGLTCVNGGGLCSDASGTARCQCVGRFAGPTCEACATGWTGAACDTCAAGYSGANCDECAPGYQDNDGNGSCEPSCVQLSCSEATPCVDDEGPASCFAPQSCADIKQQDPAATDGTYTVYHQGRLDYAWLVYCKDMATTPLEYLTLQQTGPGQNTSYIQGSDAYPFGDAYTAFQRLRIDPKTLAVKVNDFTFATFYGSDVGGMTLWGYGSAANCTPNTKRFAETNVDLRGTRFRPDGQFCIIGWGPTGASTVDPSSDQLYYLKGRGLCGGIYPRIGGCRENGHPDGWDLQLQIKACEEGHTGADCLDCAPGYVSTGSGICASQ